jgi:uncharacterized membrane protein YfcA
MISGSLDPIALARLVAVTLIAAAVQGAVGFGFTLLAVSSFLLILQSGDAVQLLLVVNLVISLTLVGPLWEHVDRGLLGRLVAGSLLGFPLGLVAFQWADVDQLKVGAAFAILVFVGAAALQQCDRGVDPAPRTDADSASEPEEGAGAEPGFSTPAALGVGALAGGMTTALGTPGPPLVIYLNAIELGKDATRALTLTFFAVAYGLAVVL